MELVKENSLALKQLREEWKGTKNKSSQDQEQRYDGFAKQKSSGKAGCYECGGNHYKRNFLKLKGSQVKAVQGNEEGPQDQTD